MIAGQANSMLCKAFRLFCRRHRFGISCNSAELVRYALGRFDLFVAGTALGFHVDRPSKFDTFLAVSIFLFQAHARDLVCAVRCFDPLHFGGELFRSFFRELTHAVDEKTSLGTKVVSGARARLHAEAFQW